MHARHPLRSGPTAMLLAAALPVVLGLAPPRAAAVPLTEARIAPAEISIGESAELTIKTAGTDMQPPPLPVVAGLEFRVTERLHGMDFVHGVGIATTTTVVRVTPRLAGTFIIPDGTPGAPPLTLRVLPANVGPVPSRIPGSAIESKGIRLSQDGAAFVRLTVDRRDVYVGESVPLTIEVGMRAGMVTSLNGLPALDASDFTLNSLSRRPERDERLIAGQPFVVLVWHSVLAPIKAGDYALTVGVPLTLRVSTRPRGEVELEDRLGDPFMQRIFGATVRKEIRAASPPLELHVDPLPAEGRPPEFSGAVGSFGVTSDVSAASAAAGDPLTLRMHVTGSGNFDRVDSAMLEHAQGWKTYPPTSSFKSGDAVGVKGEKIFEQPVVATQQGALVLPALAFTYFDPVAHRYETARAAPLTVTVAAPASETPAGAPSAAGGAALVLRPDRPAVGRAAGSLVPPYLRPPFLALPLLLAAFVGGSRLRARMPASSSRAPHSAAARRLLAELESAARAGDSARFFALARRAVQESLAARWNLRPDELTPAELEARLGDDAEEIRQLFALADEVSYAARDTGRMDYSRWSLIVRRRTLPGEAP